MLERAVTLKNMLKNRDRVEKIARFVANHFRDDRADGLQGVPGGRGPGSLRALQGSAGQVPAA